MLKPRNAISLALSGTEAALLQQLIQTALAAGFIMGTQQVIRVYEDIMIKLNDEAHEAGWCTDPACINEYHKKRQDKEERTDLGRDIN